MKSRLILFDVDGTLIDTAGAGKRAMERAFREVLEVDGFEPAGNVAYAGRTDPVILDALVDAFGVDRTLFVERRDRLLGTFLGHLATEMRRPDPQRRILPGVRLLLERLDAESAVHLGLLTGNMESGARIKLEPFDLNRFFPGGGFASDDADRREIARIARRKLARLTGVDFSPAAVTVVGDTPLDVDCARANGFRAVAVDSGWVSRAELELSEPDALLDDLGDPGVMTALGLADDDQLS